MTADYQRLLPEPQNNSKQKHFSQGQIRLWSLCRNLALDGGSAVLVTPTEFTEVCEVHQQKMGTLVSHTDGKGVNFFGVCLSPLIEEAIQETLKQDKTYREAVESKAEETAPKPKKKVTRKKAAEKQAPDVPDLERTAPVDQENERDSE